MQDVLLVELLDPLRVEALFDRHGPILLPPGPSLGSCPPTGSPDMPGDRVPGHAPGPGRAALGWRSTKEAGMTEVAEAPGVKRAQELKRITHWIKGGPVAGESGRTGRSRLARRRTSHSRGVWWIAAVE